MPSSPAVAPEAPEQHGAFLSLAPATSASYPQQQPRKTSSAAIGPTEEKRRTSSSSSGPRILKLGPVHGGQHLGEGDEDWHEVAVV